MGKKATVLLSKILFAVATLIWAGLAAVGSFAGSISPDKSWFITLLALGMTPLLLVNLLSFIFWLCRGNFVWMLIPFVVIGMNHHYISSCFRINVSDAPKETLYLKVVSYNIYGHKYKDFNAYIKLLLEHFEEEGADILCFQEYSDRTNTSQLELNETFKHRVVVGENYGMQLAVYSRYPIKNAQLISFNKSVNCAMTAEVEVNGQAIHIVNAHLQTTNLGQSGHEISAVKDFGIDSPDGKRAFDILMSRLAENAAMRTEQVSIVRAVIDSKLDRPMIVCGDFNDPPSTYTYSHMKKGLIDGFEECGSGYLYTYNKLCKLFRLDYLFYTSNFKGLSHKSPNLPWSDHNPVIMGLGLRL